MSAAAAAGVACGAGPRPAGRATALLAGPDGQVPPGLAPVLEAICAARNPRSALNWLRRGAGAAMLADLAAGKLPASHLP